MLNESAIAALATAACWAITAVAFEYAGKRIGAFALNLLRLVVGFVFLGSYSLIRGMPFIPVDASLSAWIWLGASGVVGLALGDLLLFQAFIDVGSRLSMLIYATAPAMTAFLSFLVLGESLSLVEISGMVLTMSGISLVILARKPVRDPAVEVRRTHRGRGLALAFGASLGQAAGLLLGKIGAGSMDAFAGTQIRVCAGIVGFVIAIAISKTWKQLFAAFKDRRAMGILTLGSFFGPFLGVSLSLLAIQTGKTGVASAIMSIVPVLLLAPAAFLLKEKITIRDIAGAVVAVAGVFLLFRIFA